MIIENGIILHYDRLVDGHLRIDGGKVTETGGDVGARAAEPVIEARGCYVLPGLIDVHTHGLRDVLPQNGGWLRYSDLQMEQGVTACVPTLFAAPEAIVKSIDTGLQETDDFTRTPNLLGFRLEFPYVAKPGAGLLSALKPITPETTRMLYDAARGYLRIWDVSPELQGALPFIRWATEHGIVTSLAHSAATVEQARQAVDAGLSLVTHFYDAFDVAVMTDPGVYPAGLADYIQVEAG
jgi:N-acetylglucosamine-6-phosphate deacetylase